MGRGRSAFAPAAAASRPTRIPRRGTVDASETETETGVIAAYPIETETGVIAAYLARLSVAILAQDLGSIHFAFGTVLHATMVSAVGSPLPRRTSFMSLQVGGRTSLQRRLCQGCPTRWTSCPTSSGELGRTRP